MEIDAGPIIGLEIQLRGTITIGNNTLVLDKASIFADAGPISIGENNIIEEKATITCVHEDLLIGVNNIFKSGCEIQARAIGDHNVFESECYVGPNIKIGNGCIIGAGCRITAPEKLQDHTAVTGRDYTQSGDLDRTPAPDDLERQQDELTAMSAILSEEEFTDCSKSTAPCAILDVQVLFQSRFVIRDMDQGDFPVDYLPPIQLIATLPQDYPSQSCPSFTLSSCWLSKSKLDLLAVKLERLWEDNRIEILYVWFMFLQEESLKYLKINDGYSLREECQLNISATNPEPVVENESDMLVLEKETLVKKQYELMKSYRCEQAYDKLRQYLLQYSSWKENETFNKAIQECNTCLSNMLGILCSKLKCGHVSCNECLKLLCEVKINDGSKSIECAQTGCEAELPVSLIQDLVTKELYDKFDKTMLTKVLEEISNSTYCPVLWCQYPILKPPDDNGLAICPWCEKAFCVFCKKVYHGIENCDLTIDVKKKLAEDYKNATRKERSLMEKRYGQKKLKELVATAETENWIRRNSQKCPACRVNIEKNDGCNKMKCTECKKYFCWLCLTILSTESPYTHYQDETSQCFNLLIDGIFDPEEEDVDI